MCRLNGSQLTPLSRVVTELCSMLVSAPLDSVVGSTSSTSSILWHVVFRVEVFDSVVCVRARESCCFEYPQQQCR
jgi:hypothetical protein